MRRFYVPGPLNDGEELAVDGDLHARMTRVLRLETGAQVVLFDGGSAEWPAELVQVSRKEAVLHLGLAERPEREPARRVVLYQALIRPALFELVLEKGT